jgi:hypothetical protein
MRDLIIPSIWEHEGSISNSLNTWHKMRCFPFQRPPPWSMYVCMYVEAYDNKVWPCCLQRVLSFYINWGTLPKWKAILNYHLILGNIKLISLGCLDSFQSPPFPMVLGSVPSKSSSVLSIIANPSINKV